jgi:hypothetical protein
MIYANRHQIPIRHAMSVPGGQRRHDRISWVVSGLFGRLGVGSGWRVSTHRNWPEVGGLAANRAPVRREGMRPLMG